MTSEADTRTVHDPFHGKDVQISNRLTDRLRGKYASGPTMPNGEPEFGWRQMPQIPIQVEAADVIDERDETIRSLRALLKPVAEWLDEHGDDPTLDDMHSVMHAIREGRITPTGFSMGELRAISEALKEPK